MIQELIEILQAIWDAKSQRQKADWRYFEAQIEPLFERMYVIHCDYLKCFYDAQISIENRESPTLEIVDFLKRNRRTSLCDRQSQRERARAIRSLTRRFDGRPDLKSRLDKLAKAVENYFRSPSVIDSSWYSYFIETLECYSRIPLNPWSTIDRTIGGDPRSYLVKTIGRLIDRTLPLRWKRICRSYEELRAVMLE